jgi:transcriptional regulator with XRE-family HTH domain
MRAGKCSCGGQLREVNAARVELAPLFGLRGTLEGRVPALRCDACGAETFEGKVLDRMLLAVARAVLTQPRILSTEEARFLRKSVLGLTQARLAERMGINPITVADWERGERPMSKEHDYELRGIVLGQLLQRGGSGAQALIGEVDRILAAPRLQAPPKRPKPYVISAKLRAA